MNCVLSLTSTYMLFQNKMLSDFNFYSITAIGLGLRGSFLCQMDMDMFGVFLIL